MISYLTIASILFLSLTCTTSTPDHESFIQCMTTQHCPHTKSLQTIFQASNSSLYSYLLQFSQQNPRWLNSTTAKPLFILTPFQECEIQAAIFCSKKHGLQIRVRSGGHDYEGLSYRSQTPFIIIDLINLRFIEINLEDETAWVQAGATLGELYYSIAKKSEILGFPAGTCTSVGVGGHFSGGGQGSLTRKYGLSADHVLDAYLINANGKILDRKAMGEDLFWAIRGGGGASFGIILSWKIKLVRVPPTVTTFTISKTLQQGATELVNRWQHIADKLPEDLFIRVTVQQMGTGGQKTVQASFNSLFLGGIDRLASLMNKSFPELGLQAKDYTEMSWIQSILYFWGHQKDDPTEVLLDRVTEFKSPFKAKSDFVRDPIPKDRLKDIWERLMEENTTAAMVFEPFGGRMNEISESEIAFPHRKGNLYIIQYVVKWDDNGPAESRKHLNWIRSLYKYMEPYVHKNPRSAYLNFRDLDLGTNKPGKTSYSEARVWGEKYFKGNFKRLAEVKSKADPENFFRSEQSIPVLYASN